MLCDNNFCIYWEYDNCSLDEITLDARGCCNDCIFVPMKEDELFEKRKELLLRYDAEWKRMEQRSCQQPKKRIIIRYHKRKR